MSSMITNFAGGRRKGRGGDKDVRDHAWRFEAQDKRSLASFALTERGLEIEAPAEVKTLSLRHDLPVPVESEGTSLQIALTIQAESRTALKEALSAVSIFRTREGRPPTLVLRFSHALFRNDGPKGLRLDATVSWLAGGGEHTIEFRFEAGTPKVVLAQIGIDVAVPPGARAPAPARRPPPPGLPERALRVAVVTWEVTDNPFGRAHVLADMAARGHGVEILGCAFTRPQQGIWPPLRDTTLPLRVLEGAGMDAFLPAAQALAESVTCDLVHVSKARFPGLLLAMLVKHRLGCPVVLDLDDHEMAFFPGALTPDPERLEADLQERADLDRPQDAYWTGLAEALIPSVADRTVANRSLQARFGGMIVRHGRDEAVFRPDPALRARARTRLEIADDDRVILFAGTPRRHKGLDRLIAALDRLADPRLLLVVAGTLRDRAFQAELAAFTRARVRFLPDVLFSELPDLLQVADGVCLLQDAASPVTEFQTPAKLSDALSMGIPVAMTPVAPVADMLEAGLVSPIRDEADLEAWLLGVAAGEDVPAGRQRRLDLFDAELGYGVNGARLDRAFARALERPMHWPEVWTRLFRALNRRFGSTLPEAPPAWAQRTGLAAPAVRRRRPLDLICFWKQNDTGIYGRRHDMLLKYLRQSEHVGTIVQFDAPVRIDRLRADARAAAASDYHHGKLIADATARRFLEIDDEPGLIRRTFVYGRDGGGSYLGRGLPQAADYQAYVAETVARHCSGNRVGWAWPVAPLHGEIAGSLDLDLSVVDLVDDQRTMARDARRIAEAEAAYERTLAQADLVFANCEAVGRGFAPLSPVPIHVVPNACEFYGAAGGRPRELADIEGPIIGYVGNLRARIDVALLEEMIARRPSWTFVLIGSAHNSTDILRLRSCPNLRLLGPKVYEEALRYMRGFDVAIMPHLRNAVSDHMNPLKLYVYVALGIPVVTSDVANIGELAGRIAVAADGADFLAKLDDAVARRTFSGPNRPPPVEALWPISWPKRVADMLGLCRQRLMA